MNAPRDTLVVLLALVALLGVIFGLWAMYRLGQMSQTKQTPPTGFSPANDAPRSNFAECCGGPFRSVGICVLCMTIFGAIFLACIFGGHVCGRMPW